MKKFLCLVAFGALFGCGSSDGGSGATLQSCLEECDSLQLEAAANACVSECQDKHSGGDNKGPQIMVPDGGAEADAEDPGGRPANWPVGCEAQGVGLIARTGANDVCGAETKACLSACATPGTTQQQYLACTAACYSSDTGTPHEFQGQQVTCEICTNYQQSDCLYANGCEAEVGALNCCYFVEGQACAAAGGDIQGCITQKCGGYATAISTCAQTTPSSQVCGDYANAAYDICFP